MDFEKAYKSLVAKVKNAHLYAQTDSTKNVLEDILPELRESEDERIRKALIDMVKRETGFTGFPSQGQVLAYLEKQKEPLPIPDKFSGLKSLMLQYLQSAANRKDDTEIESDTDLFGRKILDYVWKYDEKQKEQKPAEVDESTKRLNDNWMKQHFDDYKERKPVEKQDYSGLNDLERAIHRGFLSAGVENVPVTIIKETAKDCLAHMPAEWSEEDETRLTNILIMLKEYAIRYYSKDDVNKSVDWLKNKVKFLRQVKQDWSEEDEKMRNLAIEWAETMYGQFRFVDMGSTDFRKIVAWLKSLRPQPKQEWSEKETKDLVHILKILDDCYVYGKHDLSKTDYDNLTSMIKSLRPSWKPSEEQMDALIRCIAPLEHKYYCILSELYEQLKKL